MNSPVQVSHGLRVFIAVLLTVTMLRYGQDFFVPLALAVLMTFVLAPIVDWLHRWHISRPIAVIFSVAVAVGLIGILLYVVFSQFNDLARELPRYRSQLRANLADLSGFLKGGVSGTSRAVEQLSRELARVAPGAGAAPIPAVQVIERPPTAIRGLQNFIAPFLKPVGTAAVVIVFAIFMLLRLHDLRDRFIRVLGSENLRTTTEALTDAAQRVSRFLLMQTLINTWQGLCVTAGLWYIGVPNAMLWGALTVALRFIPYIGPWVAAAMPVSLSLAVFDDWDKTFMVVALFIAVELISNMVLEPWLYGRRTGISPLALLVAATFWTWLWGAVGLFLAVPLTVCVMVMGKHIPQLEFLYVLLGDEPVFDPHEQLYQRLLTGNREEAEAILARELRTKSPRRVADDVLLSAVRMAERDHATMGLGELQRKVVQDVLACWEIKLIEARLPQAALRRVKECRARVETWTAPDSAPPGVSPMAEVAHR